jgi:predicted ester cyclase
MPGRNEMSIEENLRLSREAIDAYNAYDFDRTMKLWADEEMGLARKEWQLSYWLAAFPDTHMEAVSWTAQDERVVLEAILRATHLGPLKFWVTESIPATNKKIEFLVCEVFQWKNGKLKDIQAYLDRGHILKQLDLEAKVDWEQFR